MANPIYTKKSVVCTRRNIIANDPPKQNAISDIAEKTINIQPNVNITTFLNRLPTVAPKLDKKLAQQLPGIQVFIKSRLLTDAKKESIVLKIKSLLDFPSCIKHLQIRKWVIDQDQGVVRDNLNREKPFSTLESTFKFHEERFRLFLQNNDLRYDANSGLLVLKDELLPFEESNAVMKYFIAKMELEDQTSHKMDSGFTGIAEAPLNLNRVEIDTLNHINDRMEKQVRLTLKSYIYFEHALALLQTQKWVIIQGEPYALDPSDQLVPISDLKTRFLVLKEAFTEFLARKKLSYDPSVGWIMGEKHIPTVAQTSALIDEFIEWEKNRSVKGDVKVTLRSIMEWDTYLAELKVHRWTVNKDVGYVQGPKGEFFTFDEMNEKLFEPRKNQFNLYLKNNGYNYDNLLGMICKGNFAVDPELADSLLRNFINGEKAKLEALRRQSTDSKKSVALPDYKEVKEVLTLMLNFEEVLSKLVEWKWKVNADEGYLLTPDGTLYLLGDVKEKWGDYNLNFQKLAGFDSSKMDQVFETIKEPILNEFVKKAAEYKMSYDKEMNHFTDGENKKTIEQMMIALTLNELEIY